MTDGVERLAICGGLAAAGGIAYMGAETADIGGRVGL